MLVIADENPCEQPKVVSGWWVIRRKMGEVPGKAEMYPEGTVMTLTCDSGVQIKNGGKMTCSNGKWDPDPKVACVKGQ